MTKKDLANNRLFSFKKVTPTLIAGAVAFSFSQAIADFEEVFYDDSVDYSDAESDSTTSAGFTAIVHDEKNYITCNVKKIIRKNNNNTLILLEDSADCYQYMYGSEEIIDGDGNLLKDDTLTFYIPTQTEGKYKAAAGCTFSSTTLNQNGELVIGGDKCFDPQYLTFYTQDPPEDGYLEIDANADGKHDYLCFIDESSKNAYAFNIRSYETNHVCDETLPASITAGNVTVTGANPVTVEFRTQGTVRINPPFTVASEHVFKVNTGMISGS